MLSCKITLLVLRPSKFYRNNVGPGNSSSFLQTIEFYLLNASCGD